MRTQKEATKRKSEDEVSEKKIKQKIEKTPLMICLNDLAWLLEKGKSSCTAICLINNKLIVADNTIATGSKIDNKIINFQSQVLRYLVQFITNKNEETRSLQRKEFLKQAFLIKIQGSFKGQAVTSIKKETQNLIADSLLKNSKLSISEIRKLANFPHAEEEIAIFIAIYNKLVRRLERIEKFLEDNPENSLYKALDQKNEVHLIELSEFGAVCLLDYNWLIDNNAGCAFLLTNENGTHAELKIIDFLFAARLITSKSSVYSAYEIGISKKCCLACQALIDTIHKVLKDFPNNSFAQDIIKVTGHHSSKFPNWAKHLPIFLREPDAELLNSFEQGLFYAEEYQSIGYLVQPDNSTLPLSSLEEVKNPAQIFLYRDYKLIKKIREKFDVQPFANSGLSSHSPMSQSSPYEGNRENEFLLEGINFIPNHIPTAALIDALIKRFLIAKNILPEEKTKIEATLNELKKYLPDVGVESSNEVARQVIGNFKGQNTLFNVYKTKGDGSCGYYSLPISHDRLGVAKLLLGNNTPKIRALVAPEIMEAHRANQLPEKMLAKKEFQLFKRTQIEIDEAQQKLLSSILDKLDPDNKIIKDRQFEKVLEFLQEKPNKTEADNKHLASLTEFQQKLLKQHKDFEAFCQGEEVFKDFVQESIAKDGELAFMAGGIHTDKPTGVLDAILQCAEPPIRLCIWEPYRSDFSKAFIVYEGGNESAPVTHIYHSPGRDTHFELMSVAETPTSQHTANSEYTSSSLSFFAPSKSLNITAAENYSQLLERELNTLKSFALPETQPQGNQILNYLKNKTHNLNHVIVPTQIWNLEPEAFPLHEFFYLFLANSDKKKFVIPILNDSCFYGLVISKNNEGWFEFDYFDPTANPNSPTQKDNNIRLKLMHLNDTIKKQILSILKKEAVKDEVIGNQTISADIISKIKVIRYNLLTDLLLINSSNNQQLGEYDGGYIVAGILYEKAANIPVSIPIYKPENLMASAAAIAKIRDEFCRPQIVGQEMAHTMIVEGYARRLTQALMNISQDRIDSYYKNLNNKESKLIMDKISPIMKKIHSKDFDNYLKLAPEEFILRLIKEALEKEEPRAIQQFYNDILTTTVNEENMLRFSIKPSM